MTTLVYKEIVKLIFFSVRIVNKRLFIVNFTSIFFKWSVSLVCQSIDADLTVLILSCTFSMSNIK